MKGKCIILSLQKDNTPPLKVIYYYNTKLHLVTTNPTKKLLEMINHSGTFYIFLTTNCILFRTAVHSNN